MTYYKRTYKDGSYYYLKGYPVNNFGPVGVSITIPTKGDAWDFGPQEIGTKVNPPYEDCTKLTELETVQLLLEISHV